jgi:glutaredoxin
MRSLPLKLGPGSDLRRSLEQLAIEQGASGFVLGVVGNLSRATFQCAGRSGPTILEGDLEIITLQDSPPAPPAQPAVEVAVLPGCPWSQRALRILRTLGIPHQVTTISGDAEFGILEQRTGSGLLPQVFIEGQFIGGYDELADLQGRGGLERLRQA